MFFSSESFFGCQLSIEYVWRILPLISIKSFILFRLSSMTVRRAHKSLPWTQRNTAWIWFTLHRTRIMLYMLLPKKMTLSGELRLKILTKVLLEPWMNKIVRNFKIISITSGNIYSLFHSITKFSDILTFMNGK